MPVYALHYAYTEDTAARDTHRAEHRAYLRDLADRGVVVAAGAYAPGEPHGALIVVRAPDKDAVAELVAGDPFRREGVVAGYTVTEWTPVIGPWADAAGEVR